MIFYNIFMTGESEELGRSASENGPGVKHPAQNKVDRTNTTISDY